MPYIHRGCGGAIKWRPFLPIPPKCSTCGKKWSPLTVYAAKPPEDMRFVVPEVKLPELKRGTTSYAPWADYIPHAGFWASRLPNWPKWARITATVSIVVAVAFAYTQC